MLSGISSEISSDLSVDYYDEPSRMMTRSLAMDPKVISEVNSVTAILLIVLGFLANVILMVILLVKWRNTTSNTIHVLKNVAFINLIHSCFVIPTYWIQQRNWYINNYQCQIKETVPKFTNIFYMLPFIFRVCYLEPTKRTSQ